LAAAFELKKIGCNIKIFEASNRIGGRIYTHYFDSQKKYMAELGAMRIPTSHETTWHYINIFKLPTKPFAGSNINGLIYLRNSRARNDPRGLDVMKNIYPRYNLPPEERNIPWQKLSDRLYNTFLNSLAPDVRMELLQTKPIYSEAIKIIDKLSLRSGYESVGLSQNAISMIGNLSPSEASFFDISLTEILQEAYTIDFSYVYYIPGGMVNLPLSIYKALINEMPNAYKGVGISELGKVSFNMLTAVDSIYKSPSGEEIILQCRDTLSGECRYEKFDYIVCAIPYTSLRRVKIEPLFTVRKMQAIRELNYEPGHKTFLFMKDRFWEKGSMSQRIVGGASPTDLPNTVVYYPSDHAEPIPNVFNGWTLKPGVSPEEPGVLLSSYNWSEDALRLGNEKSSIRIMDLERYIEEIHGLPKYYIEEKLISWASILWSRVQYIWGGGNLAQPQDKLLFSYINTVPEMNDRVFFAGEHISQKHVWQQGALQTGMLAANGIAYRIMMRRG
jgi:monoamine oxidase